MLRVHTRILLLLAVLLRSVQSLNSATQAQNPEHYWPHAASHATAATEEGTGLVSRIADGMKEASSKISAFAKDVADHARAATHEVSTFTNDIVDYARATTHEVSDFASSVVGHAVETVDNVHNAICDRFQGFVDSIKKAVFGKGTPVEKKEPKDAKGTSVEEKTPKHDAKETTSDGSLGSSTVDTKVDAKESTINASLGSSTVDTKVDAKEIVGELKDLLADDKIGKETADDLITDIVEVVAVNAENDPKGIADGMVTVPDADPKPDEHAGNELTKEIVGKMVDKLDADAKLDETTKKGLTKEITALGKPENSKDPEVATEKATPRELMFACMGLEEAPVEGNPFEVKECFPIKKALAAPSEEEPGEVDQPTDKDLTSCCVKLYHAEDDELLLEDDVKDNYERASDQASRPTEDTISKFIERTDAVGLRNRVQRAKEKLAGARFKHLGACRGRGAVEDDVDLLKTLWEKSMAVKGRAKLKEQCKSLMQTYVASYFGSVAKAGDAMADKVAKAVEKIVSSYGSKQRVETVVKEGRVAVLVSWVANNKAPPLDCSKSEKDMTDATDYQRVMENARKSGCSQIEENVKNMFNKELEYTKNPRPLSLDQMQQMYELMDADKKKTKYCAAVPERAPVAEETLSSKRDYIWTRPFVPIDTDTAGVEEYEQFRERVQPPEVEVKVYQRRKREFTLEDPEDDDEPEKPPTERPVFKLSGSEAFGKTCQNIECKDKHKCCGTHKYTLMRVGPSAQGKCREYTTAQVLLYYTLSDPDSLKVWDPVFTSKFRLHPYDCEFCIVEEKTDLVQFVAKVPFKWQVRACTQDELDKSTARENDSEKAKEFDEEERDLYKKTTLLACQVKTKTPGEAE